MTSKFGSIRMLEITFGFREEIAVVLLSNEKRRRAQRAINIEINTPSYPNSTHNIEHNYVDSLTLHCRGCRHRMRSWEMGDSHNRLDNYIYRDSKELHKPPRAMPGSTRISRGEKQPPGTEADMDVCFSYSLHGIVLSRCSEKNDRDSDQQSSESHRFGHAVIHPSMNSLSFLLLRRVT